MKKGDNTNNVIKAAKAFPNFESSTKGKIYCDESKMIATIITEWITICVKLALKTICQSLTDLIDSVFALYLSMAFTHFLGILLSIKFDTGTAAFII